MVEIDGVKRQFCRDFEGQETEELLIRFSDSSLLRVYSGKAGPFFLCIRNGRAVLSVRLFHGELKYFFPDWQSYDYLPAEDRAIHVSVSSFVPRDRRKKATKRTAYVRQEGVFLPWPDPSLSSGEKYFYREYNEFPAYILCPMESSLSWEMLSDYLTSVLSLFIL